MPRSGVDTPATGLSKPAEGERIETWVTSD